MKLSRFSLAAGSLLLCLPKPSLSQSATLPITVKDGEKLYQPELRTLKQQNVETDTNVQKTYCTDATALPQGINGETTCSQLTANFSKATNGNGYFNQYQVQQAVNTWGPGWYFGGSASGSQNYGWRNSHAYEIDAIFSARALSQGFSISALKHAIGDHEGLYLYGFCDGGVYGGADEGCTAASMQGGEVPGGYFHGKVLSGGVGAILPTLSYTSGNAWTTDGTFLLDITQGTLSGILTGYSQPMAAPFTGWLGYLTVGGVSLPLTQALGSVISSGGDVIPTPHTTANAPVPMVLTVQLQPIGGSTPAFTAGGQVCIAGNEFPEKAAITAVTPASGGTQQITVMVRNPNTLAAVFQGGICGQYISFDANLAMSGYRTSYWAFGSLTGTDLIYGNNIAGGLGRRVIPDGFGSEVEGVGAGTATVTGANGTGLVSGFHLYPGAEIVMNNSTAYAPTLEANAVHWTPGDVVEDPHAQTVGGHGIQLFHNQYSPTNSYYGSSAFAVTANGYGVSGPYRFFDLLNPNPDSIYLARGGPLSAPQIHHFAGAYSDGMTFEEGPQYSARGTNSLFSVWMTAAGDSSPFNLFDLPGFVSGVMTSHAYKVGWDPGANAVLLPGLTMYSLKATTGTRFLCINQYGQVVSQTAACSGT